MAHYRQAVRFNPNDATAHYNLGRILANRGQLDEAVIQFQKTLEIRHNDDEAHNNLGIALAGLGRIDEALRTRQGTGN